jgi:hypothetical protein
MFGRSIGRRAAALNCPRIPKHQVACFHVAGNGFHISQERIVFWESKMVNALVYAAELIAIKFRYFFMQVMTAVYTLLDMGCGSF